MPVPVILYVQMGIDLFSTGFSLDSVLSLKSILFLIFVLFSNPLVPDWGLQLLVALAIGMILPERVVHPLDTLISKIPGVNKFKGYLENHKWMKRFRESGQRRIQQIIPRVIAGYLFTYLIGWLALLFWLILP